MGAPWIAQKAAASASPTMRFTVTPKSFEVKAYGLIGALKNEYALGAPSAHKAMDGSSSPATLEIVGETLVLRITHARGDIMQSFAREGDVIVMMVVLSRGGAEVLRMRRVHGRVAE